MKLSKSLISLTFTSTLFLLSLTAAAYSQSSRVQLTRSERSPRSAITAELAGTSLAHSAADGHASPDGNHAMPDMDHSTPDGSHAMPGMDHSMPGMDHGSMSLGPVDDYFDLRFLDAMILHHLGAVRMAEEALEKSDRRSVRQLAREMIRTQGREVRRMQNWRDAWYPNADEQPLMYVADKQQTLPMSEQMRDVMMMNIDLGSADDEFDLRFINGMIPHHEGAVAMAGEALQKSDRPEIRRLSQSILSLQQQEIVQMRTWRNRWYNE